MQEEGDIQEDYNTNELKQHLESLQMEFQNSYTQRRSQEFNNPKEELVNVIQELTQREQTCMAVAGIALYLIDKNEGLLDQYHNLEDKNRQIQAQLDDKLDLLGDFQQKLAQKTRKKTMLKSELDDRESRLKEYQDCIEELKQEHENLYSQFVQIQNEKDQKKKNQPRTSILLLQQTQLIDIKKELEQQISSLQKEVQQLEKKLKETKKLENQWQQQAIKSQEENTQLKEKLQEYYKKLQTIEEENQSLLCQTDDLIRDKEKLQQERINAQQQLDIELKRRKSTTELMLQQASFGNRRESVSDFEPQDQHRSNSLFDEMSEQQIHRGSIMNNLKLTSIAELQEENNYYSPNETPKAKKEEIQTFDEIIPKIKPNLQIKVIEILHFMDGQVHSILPDRRKRGKTRQFIKPRKPPLEEYFHLLSQAVKMNSPYMDTICSINNDLMYFQCIQQGIPFQNWLQ